MRLVIGVFVLYEATTDHAVLLYIMGSFLTLHAILNIGCNGGKCTTENCEIPAHNPEK